MSKSHEKNVLTKSSGASKRYPSQRRLPVPHYNGAAQPCSWICTALQVITLALASRYARFCEVAALQDLEPLNEARFVRVWSESLSDSRAPGTGLGSPALAVE